MRATTDRPRPQPRKRFGQHFLEDVWARKVVAAINPQRTDAFLEIGPGPGAITRPLAAAAGSVVACEIDRDLAAALREEQIPRVRILEGDFLRLPLETLRDALVASAPDATSFRVAGNLPYNIASPIMFRLVELHGLGLPLQDATVMLQREVADRLLAKTGTGDYSDLTVIIGHRASVDRLLNLPPGAFRPAPKVQSSVGRLRVRGPEPPVQNERIFAGVVGAVFSRRRKTIGNALLAYGGVTPATSARVLSASGLDPGRRPETLSIPELALVANAVAAVSGEHAGRTSDVPVV